MFSYLLYKVVFGAYVCLGSKKQNFASVNNFAEVSSLLFNLFEIRTV